MSMYGKDHEYAHSRLVDTIVRIDKEPVFIYGVTRGMKVQYAKLDTLDDIKVCVVDDLDLHPVPLGYCNYNKCACYLSRVPMRRDWRQGLRRGNFFSIGMYGAERIPYDAIRQTILNDYPTFTAAVKAAPKLKSVAWHRYWSIAGDLVYYKGGISPVGQLINGKIELDSKSQYLAEALLESL